MPEIIMTFDVETGGCGVKVQGVKGPWIQVKYFTISESFRSNSSAWPFVKKICTLEKLSGKTTIA